MKKVISVILAVIMAATFCVFFASAEESYVYDGTVDYVLDGIGYDLTNLAGGRYARIVDGSAATGDVTIPEFVTVDGAKYRTVAIVGGAFTGCVGLKSVTLPDFEGFTIINPDGTLDIVNGVFVDCDQTVRIYYYAEQAAISVYVAGTDDNVNSYILDIDKDIDINLFDFITSIFRQILNWIKSLFKMA